MTKGEAVNEMMPLSEIDRHENMLMSTGALTPGYSSRLFFSAREALRLKGENEKLRKDLKAAQDIMSEWQRRKTKPTWYTPEDII